MLWTFAALPLVSAVPVNPGLGVSQTPAPFFYPISTVYKNDERSFAQIDDPLALAVSSISQQFGVPSEQLRIASHFKDSHKVVHVYMDRLVNGLMVANHNAAVHIADGVVSSISASFSTFNSFAPIKVADTAVKVSLETAVASAEATYQAKRDSVPATTVYLQVASGDLLHVHAFQLRNDKTGVFLHVSVDTHSGKVVEVVNYVARASYKAIQLPDQTPDAGFKIIKNPADPKASPSGWNSDGTTTYADTRGNNVHVYNNGDVADLGVGNKDLVFDSNWDKTADPTSPENKQASLVHLFYLINTMHDIMYQYGFTESAGNFQQTNFDPKSTGLGGDPVLANDMSSDGTNNANFYTPPDGQSGEMNMYLFTMTTPGRDGSLDSVIPIHEFTHGVSNRLTGGAKNGRCLQSSESGGMGEGWSDTVAIFLGRTAKDTRKTDAPMGTYVLGQNSGGAGIRQYVYSTDMATNPYTFASIAKNPEVHAVGEIWATMLNEVYWNLVDKLGFSKNWKNSMQKAGNIVAMQVVIGGLMLQPCNPTFTQARDAIIQADAAYYGGSNKCDIWKAFAKRGLGSDSVQKGHKDGFALPKGCSS